MKSNFYAVFVAGGSGVRMGADKPKQFLEIGGKPILRLTIEKFIAAVPDINIVTVLPKDYISYWKEYCIEKNFHHPQILVPGGITRFHSVQNALKKIPDGAVVAIHDGVRPLISKELIAKMFESMSSVEALIPVVPVVDTLRYVDSDDALQRDKIVAVQTPQIFHSGQLKEAYGQAYDLSFTDDATVARKINIPLTFTEGERNNIKITTVSDLKLAEAILALKN